jgi:hypothetical protein
MTKAYWTQTPTPPRGLLAFIIRLFGREPEPPPPKTLAEAIVRRIINIETGNVQYSGPPIIAVGGSVAPINRYRDGAVNDYLRHGASNPSSPTGKAGNLIRKY